MCLIEFFSFRFFFISGDATHLKQFDLKDQKPKNVHFSHIRSKEGKKEILDYNFNPFVFDCKLSTCDKLVVSKTHLIWHFN